MLDCCVIWPAEKSSTWPMDLDIRNEYHFLIFIVLFLEPNEEDNILVLIFDDLASQPGCVFLP